MVTAEFVGFVGLVKIWLIVAVYVAASADLFLPAFERHGPVLSSWLPEPTIADYSVGLVATLAANLWSDYRHQENVGRWDLDLQA